MQHPDFTSQLARERQARYRADAGRSRVTRPDRTDPATSPPATLRIRKP